MKLGDILLVGMIIIIIAAVVTDRFYVSKYEKDFRELETQRIITSNQLATAKIVHEKLDHVRDLVFKNMDFPGEKNAAAHETHFFDFITGCITDLKLKLISIRPLRPEVKGRITTYGYSMEIEGDFFKFGELCAKFENSRRIASIESFEVSIKEGTFKGHSHGRQSSRSGTRGFRVTMRVNTYRVKKGVAVNINSVTQ